MSKSNNSEYIVFRTLAPWLEKVMDSLGAHDMVHYETGKILESRYLQIGQLRYRWHFSLEHKKKVKHS
jgi:hypothetical protein